MDHLTDLPSHIHFFSWATLISLELPVGFEELGEDEDTNSAMYADDLDDDDPLGGRVMAKASAVPVGDDDAFRKLAAESAGLPGRSVSAKDELEIDGLPAVQQVLRYHQDDIEVDVVRHETWAQAGNVVFSITGLAPDDRADEYLPAFEHASKTARFILL